jgi:hypothetical protein
MLLVKILNKEEFKLARKNQRVKGLVNGQAGMWAFVELGDPGKYKPHRKDDPNTERKKFYKCSVAYARTEDNLEIGRFDSEYHDVGIVIIYC